MITVARTVGKPAPPFFAAALARLRAEAGQALMVGDDIDSDVLAAQRLAITGVLVRTGKYRVQAVRDAEGTPDHILDSIAELPDLATQLAR